MRPFLISLGVLLLFFSYGQKPLDQAFKAERLRYRKVSFDILRVKDASVLDFVSRNGDKKVFSNFKALEGSVPRSGNKKLLFATNGGIFEPDFSPSGLYIEHTQTHQKLNQSEGKGNFYLKPNGVFYIGETEKNILSTQAFARAKPKCQHAIQSGPMLVIEGKIHPKFREASPNKYVRSGVGIDQQGEIIFAISNQPVNFYHFASLFEERLACPNALYLDGAISQMYLPVLGREEEGRPYGSIIAIWGEK